MELHKINSEDDLDWLQLQNDHGNVVLGVPLGKGCTVSACMYILGELIVIDPSRFSP